jgi:hypothetical protein
MRKVLLVLPILFIAPLLFVIVACSNNNAAPSAASAAGTSSAIDASASAASGDDMYYEYSMASVGKSFSMTGYSKLYVSAAGKLRKEMDMSNPAVKNDKSGPIVSIGSVDKPNQSILIDDAKKTYSINILDSSATGDNDPFKLVSTVTKIGEEKILGFNSIHVRIISTKSMGPLGKITDTIDLWNSPEVPLMPILRRYMDNNMSKAWTSMMTPAAADQLKQMGCTGFMLKMQTGSKDAGVHMELTKIRKDNFPNSMFEIPAGYKEEKQ